MHGKPLRKHFIAALAALAALLCAAGGALALPAAPATAVALDTDTITYNPVTGLFSPATIAATVTSVNSGFLTVTGLENTAFSIHDPGSVGAGTHTLTPFLNSSPIFTQKRQEFPFTVTFTGNNGTAAADGKIVAELRASGAEPELFVADTSFSFDKSSATTLTSKIFTFNSTETPTLRTRNAPEGFKHSVTKVADGEFDLALDATGVEFQESSMSAELKVSLAGAKPAFRNLDFAGTAPGVVVTEPYMIVESPLLTKTNPLGGISIHAYNYTGTDAPRISLSEEEADLVLSEAVFLGQDPDLSLKSWVVSVDATNAAFAEVDRTILATASLPGTEIWQKLLITLGGTAPLVRNVNANYAYREIDDFDIGREIPLTFETANTDKSPDVEATGADGLLTVGEIGRNAFVAMPFVGTFTPTFSIASTTSIPYFETIARIGGYTATVTIDDFPPALRNRTAELRFFVEDGAQDGFARFTFKGTLGDGPIPLTPTEGGAPDGVELSVLGSVPPGLSPWIGALITELPAGSVVSAEAAPAHGTPGSIPLAGSMKIDVPASADEAMAMTYAVETSKLAETVPSLDRIASLPMDEQTALLEALDGGGLRVIYEYVDHASGNRFVTLVGSDGIDAGGSPLTWTRARSADIVRFEDDKMKVNYVVTNAEGKPEVVADWLVIPDGRADGKIKDPLWIMNAESTNKTGSGGVGCSAGFAGAALSALATAALAGRKRRGK